ncbi:tRNA 2-selenouridine(34) synthase MnmH [Brevundimonas goettingensis]|uniref:tRNA 2-selenouridine(34) synthase MnmH n=1 Tax=Brevundimonas goettingensis TaxID=2774190 RepID=UPI001CECFFCC|nr:tRNA 2-selenouridine(34) synthase MnmH [Brevundimonas goettingensis]
MIQRTVDLGPADLAAYSAILDVRSPSEFALDHLPGAINLPVLDDAERAEVGTEYVQGSKFLARRRGAALVARNIARHLEGPLSAFDGSFRPLIYCWRGGQRSGAMATILDQVGWGVTVVYGGYQTWRRQVVRALYETSLRCRLTLIDGPTGAGKTELLARLSADGVQTLDLEFLAGHRGSLFGAFGPQPSQKLFETRLYAALADVDPARPVVVEAESSRIGAVTLPPSLWTAMQAAPSFLLDPPPERRVARILTDYADLAADAGRLDAILSRLARHLSKATVSRWRDLAAAGDLETLVGELIDQHYDPAYRRAVRPTTAAVEADVLTRIRSLSAGL